MNKSFLIVTTVVVLMTGLIGMAANDPFVGMWKADLAKSNYGTAGPPPKSLTLRIEPDGKGLKYERHRVGADGIETHNSQAVRLDGKDYPVPDRPAGETFSSTRLDANSMTWVVKTDGRQVQLLKLVVAKSGKTMTLTIDTKGESGRESHVTVIYEKQ